MLTSAGFVVKCVSECPTGAIIEEKFSSPGKSKKMILQEMTHKTDKTTINNR